MVRVWLKYSSTMMSFNWTFSIGTDNFLCPLLCNVDNETKGDKLWRDPTALSCGVPSGRGRYSGPDVCLSPVH